jgi:4'-phosphopantetheinyl transferase
MRDDCQSGAPGPSCPRMSSALLPLPPDEAHVWYLLSDEIRDPDLLASYERLLTPEEHARRARYVFEKNRHEYLLTRALARTVLSRYVAVAPEDWRFTPGSHGKPEITSPRVEAKVSFNLSNTDGMVACLCALDRDVGVDVEDIERRGETTGVADRFFSPSEVAALHALPAEAQVDRFFDYWTLKESYIKARGLGLALPLAQFSFTIAPDSIRIAFDPRLEDDPASWQFMQRSPTRRHRLAAAVRRGPGPELRFVVQKVVPLVT